MHWSFLALWTHPLGEKNSFMRVFCFIVTLCDAVRSNNHHLLLRLGLVAEALAPVLALVGQQDAGVAVRPLHLVEVGLGEDPEEGVAGHGPDLVHVDHLHLRQLLGLGGAPAPAPPIAVLLTVRGLLLKISNNLPYFISFHI